MNQIRQVRRLEQKHVPSTIKYKIIPLINSEL